MKMAIMSGLLPGLMVFSSGAVAQIQMPSMMRVSVEPLTAAFNVSVNDVLWLRGLPPFPGWPGATPLKLVKRAETSGTHSTLGAYVEQRFFWSASVGIPVETAFQIFTDGETVLFEQSFPQGLNNSTSTGAVIVL